MSNLKDRIYIQSWLQFKPYEKQASTDTYYLRLCNEVKQAILSAEQFWVLFRFLNKELANDLSCFLTSYFEDIISGTEIWNTFIKFHTRLYHKPLPFYNTEEYYEGEINQQDISFLIWYFLNTVQDEKFIAPFNGFIEKTSVNIYEVFDAAWDNAPENKALRAFYNIPENEKDFYKARNLIDIILYKTYLFYPDTFLRLRKSEQEMIDEFQNIENILSYLNETRDFHLHSSHTRLLAMSGKEWAAGILEKNHPLYHDFQDISPKIRGYFLYKGQDDTDVFLEHIASGKKFNLTKKSFDHSHTLQVIDTILFIGIVRWRYEWWFSGVFIQSEYKSDLVLDEKNSLESRSAVNFLDHQEQNVEELLEQQRKAFMDFTGGHQIIFMEANKIDGFIKEYFEHYTLSLNKTDKEKEEAVERVRAAGFLGGEQRIHDFSEDSDSGLVFFNPKSGPEIALAINSAFPLPNNLFFNMDDSEEHIMRLLFDEGLSKELSIFCIDKCSTDLPFFKEKVGISYLADIDFLLRFWKKGNYFSNPSITFTGSTS